MRTTSSRFFESPRTKFGWWAARLTLVFAAMFIFNIAALSLEGYETLWDSLRPFYVTAMLLCGLAGGIGGAIAVIRQRERSSLIWLAVLTGLFALIVILHEIVELIHFLPGA